MFEVMTCAVARIWEEEVGGRPKEDEVVGMTRKRKSTTPIKEDDRKRRKCCSPFRPWTPQEEPLPLVSKRSPSPSSSGSGQRRNYKNMTRERRIEANARERTRVHTISAAFETLRRAVPAYSHNQKLSKLSVLRIAASYILTLSRVIGEDYSADQSNPSLEECIDNVSNTIQMEGKLKKK